MNLKEQRAAALAKANAIVDGCKAAGVDLTAAQTTALGEHVAEVKRLDGLLKKAGEQAVVLAALDAQVPQDGGAPGGAKSVEGQRLALGGRAARNFGRKAAAAMVGESGVGVKAGLAPTGSAVVGQEFIPDPIAQGMPATGLLDVLPVFVRESPSFAYLRQSTRTNAAAAVADGDVKPTSSYGLERVEEALAIVAHLSEPIPTYWLTDNESLVTFLAAEMQHGLGTAVEALVPAAIDAASGVQTAALAGDLLTTTRQAITKIESLGYTPGAFVIRSENWETIELAQASTAGTFQLSSAPVDRAARLLWGVPVAVSDAPDVGEALLLGADSVAVNTDTGGVQLDWSSAVSDDFSKNQVRARCEGRFAVSVLRPEAVVRIATIGA